jgi:3-hydroxyisobutyrate dehydrogenase-like beta-hydroxyacid dehydrogenase
MTQSETTIGILYCGEMGAAVASMLISRGLRVITTCEGRSEATAARARAVGCTISACLDDLVVFSNIVVSAVSTDAAEDVVDAYCARANLAPANASFVDLNSIGPELASSLAARVVATGRGFVDGAINGLAKNLAPSGTMFLSGPRAPEVSNIIGDAMRVRLLGDAYGRASAMKMLLSGLSKGVCALFAETALTAERRGMLREMIEAYTAIYPGIMTLVQRMFPTYAQHAPRRATEMRELEETVRASRIEPCTLAGARELHEQLASISFDAAGERSLESLIEFLVGEGFLEPSKVV